MFVGTKIDQLFDYWDFTSFIDEAASKQYDVVSFSMSFALNAIPTATALLPVGVPIINCFPHKKFGTIGRADWLAGPTNLLPVMVGYAGHGTAEGVVKEKCVFKGFIAQAQLMKAAMTSIDISLQLYHWCGLLSYITTASPYLSTHFSGQMSHRALVSAMTMGTSAIGNQSTERYLMNEVINAVFNNAAGQELSSIVRDDGAWAAIITILEKLIERTSFDYGYVLKNDCTDNLKKQLDASALLVKKVVARLRLSQQSKADHKKSVIKTGTGEVYGSGAVATELQNVLASLAFSANYWTLLDSYRKTLLLNLVPTVNHLTMEPIVPYPAIFKKRINNVLTSTAMNPTPRPLLGTSAVTVSANPLSCGDRTTSTGAHRELTQKTSALFSPVLRSNPQSNYSGLNCVDFGAINYVIPPQWLSFTRTNKDQPAKPNYKRTYTNVIGMITVMHTRLTSPGIGDSELDIIDAFTQQSFYDEALAGKCTIVSSPLRWDIGPGTTVVLRDDSQEEPNDTSALKYITGGVVQAINVIIDAAALSVLTEYTVSGTIPLNITETIDGASMRAKNYAINNDEFSMLHHAVHNQEEAFIGRELND